MIVGIGVCVLYRRALSLAFPFALLVSGSAGHAVFAGVRRSQTTPPNLEALRTGEGTIDVVARVVPEGIVRDSLYKSKQESVDVEAEQLSTGDRVLSAPVGIRLTIFQQARGRRKHVMRAPGN